MAVATIVHIEASLDLIADLLVETQRALVETYSESVYQNLVTQLRVEEGQLRELYKRQSVKLEHGLEARIRHTLEEAMRASTLLYNRIDRVNVTPTGNVSLPKLKPLPLPTFEGEVQEYASYRELFTIHVDRRADLDDVSKFTYLLGTLGRDPLRIVKSLSVTPANYKIALDLLDKLYGNVHQSLVILHRKLANIFVFSLDPVELKRFRFELTIIIEEIKRLSSNDIGHGMVMSLINQKLSEGKLYRKVVEHLRKCDYTLDEFFDAIDFIIRMLEDDALQRGDKLEPDKRVDVSVRAKLKPVQNNSCPFCNERHPLHGCRRVTDVAARRRILLKRGLCFNCTNSGHRSDKCPVPNSCKNCSGNHNTAICDHYNPGKRSQSVPSTSAPSNSSSQSTTSHPVVNATPRQQETAPRPSKDKVEPKQCKSAKIAQMSNVDLPCTILPTAMAEINHKQGSKRVRLFLDTVCDFSLSYVPRKQNPADVLSRGATTQQLLKNPLWRNGPEFLRTMGEPVPYKEDDSTNERTVVAAVQEMREEIRPVPPGEIWEILQREKCWSPGPRSIARQIVRQCPECVLAFQPLLRQPPPPPLPKERINLTKPFTTVGVDHTAAIQTETRPGYILIVTCMASRAVYLDFCPSLEAEEFVLALRRFCATDGAPSFITSDNHQTFKTASNLLQGLYEEDEVQQFLRKTGIEWRFQTPRAPWKGGFFERLIGVTKRTLQIPLGKKYLPDAHVLTLVKEAEAVVNNRPLMYSGDKCEDEVLTPSHLVRGSMINLMAPILPDDHLNATFTSWRLRDRYLKLTDSLKAFRERWRKEYLSAMRARHDCRSGEPSKLHPGDVVLVKQDNQKRATWPLGRVVETYPDDDGVVRSAKVLFEDVQSLRAVSHLVPLEIAPSDDDDGVGEDDGNGEDEGAHSLPAGLPGTVGTSGDNQEIVQATTSQQQATEVLGSGENSDNNTVSENSESDVESETSGRQGRSARPLRKAAAKQRELMEQLVENEDI
ncbi:uncharacterized protein [Palaemon carinicauda]|uniref:uncharacterized protein n=1 Tax=Palaemon carinicauda TaxID=392227 RepID=UPI0035B62364